MSGDKWETAGPNGLAKGRNGREFFPMEGVQLIYQSTPKVSKRF